MVVIILEKTPPALRGDLSRWLVEPYPGVYIGHVSALVRDMLWQKCCQRVLEGGVLQAWTTNNEQHFEMRACGLTKRRIVDMEGLQLVEIPEPGPANHEPILLSGELDRRVKS
jgi:CRISPR-associated protein Cas2